MSIESLGPRPELPEPVESVAYPETHRQWVYIDNLREYLIALFKEENFEKLEEAIAWVQTGIDLIDNGVMEDFETPDGDGQMQIIRDMAAYSKAWEDYRVYQTYREAYREAVRARDRWDRQAERFNPELNPELKARLLQEENEELKARLAELEGGGQ